MRLVFPAYKALAATGFLLVAHGAAQQPHARGTSNILHIDATQPVAVPHPVEAALGSARNPQGQVLGVNSQYLTLDGKPWLPVMGEFHYSRYPEAEWEQEILKMKAAGVQIISTYVIWIHQEEIEGVFDWSGQRDLRHFVELCAKHGMYVYPRIGPWAHGEVRNGGFPDWVVKAGHLRENDPQYLAKVQTFYSAIAQQLKGELWKDGGPVIGIQIENEYGGTGAGKGEDHIRKLKAMAVADGLDVPLYTVTGWDGAAIPLDAVLPVFGGYPDAPWDGSAKAMPPNDVYAFRFHNRAAGNMGAVGGGGQNAASSYRGTPFLTAEVGDGIEDTYFRRPVVSADDVAAIVPVMLGSGANLLGYYMFHGGRNPDGVASTLEESQRTGYPTDVPVKSYDFQAPLGEYGQEAPSLRKLKLVHYFLEDFGAALAPMTPRAPDRVPASPADSSVVRVSARTAGDRGFVFLSNHVRGLKMPARADFQVQLALPSGVVKIPETPISLPSGVYGILPVNLPLGSATLRYSTAQLFKHVEAHGQSFYFFFALPGVEAEFMLAGEHSVTAVSGSVQQTASAEGLRVRVSSPAAEIALRNGVRLVLLPEAEAENVWRVDDPSVLLETRAFAFADGREWTLQSTGDPEIGLGVFGADAPTAQGGARLRATRQHGVFDVYSASLPAVSLRAQWTQQASAKPRAPWVQGPRVAWRANTIPLAPNHVDFARAAVWRLSLPALPPELSDAFLKVHYQGDAARLDRGGVLLDDNFWNGIPWTVGLKEIGETRIGELQLRVLPLPMPYPMYIEDADRLKPAAAERGSVSSIEIVPQYQIVLREGNSR